MQRYAKWVFFLLLVLNLASCRQVEEIEPGVEERDLLTVKTQRLEPSESGQKTLEFSGTLRAAKRTQVGFLRSGRVESLAADDGSKVKAGQLLASLDTRALAAKEAELRAELYQSRAASDELEIGPRPYERAAAADRVRELRSELNLVRTKLKRRRQLFAEGAIPQEELDELVTRETSLKNRIMASQNQVRDLDAGVRPQTKRVSRARIKQVQAALESLQVEYSDSQLYAPYGGTIAKRLVDEGTIVTAGQAVFELLTEDALEAELFLPPARANKLTRGQSLSVKSDLGTHSARVSRLLPQVDTKTGTQAVLLELPVAGRLKPGHLVRLQIESEQIEPGYWLPSTALVPGERGLFTCYTVQPDEGEPKLGLVQKQAVEIMSTSGPNTQVRGTLSGSPLIIAEGVLRVVPGQRVRLD